MRNLENQIKSYLNFLTIIGIFPLSITEKELVQSTSLKLYGIIITAVQIAGGSFVMTKELKQPGFGGFALRSLPCVGMFLIAATILMPIINSSIICDIFKRFNKVDRYFQELGISVSEQSIVYKPWVIVVGHLTFSFIIIALELVFPFWIIQIPYYAEYFFWLVFIMTFIMINIGTYSHLLRTRYKIINKELEKIEKGIYRTEEFFADKVNLYDICPVNNGYETVERETFPVYGNRIYNLAKSMKKGQITRKSVIVRIKKLQKSHYELSVICGNLGALFTPSIVLTILFTGIELLITMFTLVDMIMHGPMMMLALWTCVKWALIDLFRTVNILNAFSKTEKEANSTPSYVHAILLEIENPDAQKELTKFSQQLCHQKINFSTCGFFNLDMGLLVSMAGAITTYLVILLQYDSSPANKQSSS